MVTVESILEKFDSNLWGHHFIIPEEITQQFVDATNRRVKITINGQMTLQSAIMPINKTEGYILINKQVRTKLQLNTGCKAILEIEKDQSTYGMEMPDELTVLFDQEPECFEIFRNLTPGKQRTLIYLVLKVKNTNSRLNKALAIVQHLKDTKGALDFKLLNETIKHYNSLGKLSG